MFFIMAITGLQMQTYLVITDFHKRVSKKGLEYGMPVSVFLPLEAIWSYEKVTDKYKEKPAESWNKIFDWMYKMYPGSSEKDIIRMIGRRSTS